jgi:hypothetical protein
MRKSIITLIFIFIYTIVYPVIPSEIKSVKYFKEYTYKEKSLIPKRQIQIDKTMWPYASHYWKVFYNSKNNAVGEELFVRGMRIAYYSYKYNLNGNIIRKGYHWGGIRDRAYYDMGHQGTVLKRGFVYHNLRHAFEVYDNKKRLIYTEYYINSSFEHFVRYYYDYRGVLSKTIRGYEYHRRIKYFRETLN